MAMSNNRITYYELIERVSDYLGMGMAPSGDDLARVRSRIEDGYRRFLNPPILPGERAPHSWSWLAPSASLAIVAADWDYDLPRDFGQLIGTFTYAASESTVRYIEVTSIERVLRARADVNLSGDPYMVALRPKESSTVTGLLWEALFYPNPSGAMAFTYRYLIEQPKLDTAVSSGAGTTDSDAGVLTDATAAFVTDAVAVGDRVIISAANGPVEGLYAVASITDETNLVITGDLGDDDGTCTYEVLKETIYPLGTMDCTEVLVESCLSVAEMFHDDAMDIHTTQFTHLLQAAIQRDRMKGPRSLGYNGDRSDQAEGSRSILDRTISYNGTPV